MAGAIAAALPQACRLGLVAVALWLLVTTAPAEGSIHVVDRPPPGSDAPRLEQVVATPWQLGDGTEALVVRGRLRRLPGAHPHAPDAAVSPFRVALIDAHGGVGQKVALGRWVKTSVLCAAQQAPALIEAVHGERPEAHAFAADGSLLFEAVLAPFERQSGSRWLLLDRERADVPPSAAPPPPAARPAMAPPA